MHTIVQWAQKSQQPLADPGLEELAGGEPYRRFLYWLVYRLKPAAALELGVYLGQCSALMAAANRDTLVIGVDPAGLQPAAAPFAYRNFHFLHCDSLGAVQGVRGLLGARRLGLVFQDSSHHVEPSRLEWRYYQPLLAEKFVWVCDDIKPAFQMPAEPWSMVDYFNELPGQKRLLPDLHKGNVIGVILP